jgi:hypothetical protein
MLEWLERRRTKCSTREPKKRLADPITLYKRAKPSEWMSEYGGLPLKSNAQTDRDVEALNTLRKQFSHFIPQSWSIEMVGLPRIVGSVVAVPEDLLLTHPANTFRLHPKQVNRTKIAIAQLKEALTDLGRAYPH